MNILETPSPSELVLELIGIDSSFANALRRIMISEVSTMAIEYAYMWNNSSIIHDEVLCHRLGLIPLNIDPRLFDKIVKDEDGNEEEATDKNTIVFRLCVECRRNQEEDEQNDKSDLTDMRDNTKMNTTNIKQDEDENDINKKKNIDNICTKEESVHGNLELD